MALFILFFILLPIIEIITFLYLISFIGIVISLLELVFSSFFGFCLFLFSKKKLLDGNLHFISFFSLKSNSFNLLENKFYLFCMFGSLLLIIPGYISDVIGCFLLVGFFQNFIFKYLLNLVFPVAFSKKDSTMKNDDIIEGEFYDLQENKRNIDKDKKTG